jgi:hypothetical protein
MIAHRAHRTFCLPVSFAPQAQVGLSSVSMDFFYLSIWESDLDVPLPVGEPFVVDSEPPCGFLRGEGVGGRPVEPIQLPHFHEPILAVWV